LLALPVQAQERTPWPLAPNASATFEKMEELGRVRLLRGAAYEEAMNAAGADLEAQYAVRATMILAQWERANRIVVPAQAAWHLFGPKIIRGAVYVFVASDCFELWAERYYERWNAAQWDKRD
jgi:hypothetical protein